MSLKDKKSRLSKGKPHGFTLVELLVSLAVIGLLMALLLPAVQMSREAARRSQCSNNLHQLGIAVNAYLESMKVFPAGWNGYSPHAALLPHLDRAPLYNALNFQIHEALATFENLTAQETVISTFLCPTDFGPPDLKGGTNYAGNNGVGFDQTGVYLNGPFCSPSSSAISPRHVTDGASTTAAMAEWLLGAPYGTRDSRRTTFQPQVVSGPGAFERFYKGCHDIDVRNAPLSGVIKGSNWLQGGFGSTAYNHALLMNDHSCSNGGGLAEGAWTAGSQHSGGLNILFVDGHVSFLKDTISLPAWRAIGTMNGKEIISDSY